VSLLSNNKTFVISVGGTTEQSNASTVTANPDTALNRLPAFQELPKM
jgi:hypothetical protein